MSIRSRLIASISTLCIAGMASALPAAAESRSFVVSLFSPASASAEGDCSKGINIPVNEQYELDLLAAGYTKEQIEKVAEGVEDRSGFAGFNTEWARAVVSRAKINGKNVSAWINPQAAIDPNLHMVDGKFGFGFNLDGQGAASPIGFEDPLTHEKGVNNQMFRAMGCFTVFRGDLTGTLTPGAHLQAWTLVQNGMPAWLVSVSSDDLSKDGNVMVTFDVAIEHVERDAQSQVLRDMTFRVNSDPRSHHEFSAEMKDGIITLKKPEELLAIWGEEMMMPTFELHNTRMRLQLKPDGTLHGMMGGYMPWKDAMSTGLQANMGTDWVALYYNLRKSADANPDPKTGENRYISTAYFIDAVPAFAVAPDKAHKVAAR